MIVEVSIGEAIDKYSILEIKLENIKNEIKLIEIQKELKALEECKKYIDANKFLYKLLLYVNNEIWNMTDIIKSITIDNNDFSTISNMIFEFNQKRFRIKNKFNLLSDSGLKEQKSYAASYCKIILDNEKTIYDRIPEINYLLIEYDYLVFDPLYINTLGSLFQSQNIIGNSDESNNSILKAIKLEEFNISNDLKDIFDFEPITYLSCGWMGDYLQTLSVINENFIKFGKRGKLYIKEPFKNGLENSYNDTYELVTSQNYIKEYHIYNNEPFDVDLTSWYQSELLYKTSWYHIFKHSYNVEWGKNTWIDVPTDVKWNDKVIVNVMNYRHTLNIDYKKLYELFGDSMIFIAFDKKDYDIFTERSGINIEYYKPTTFIEVCTIIKSCRLLVAGMSAFLCIGHATHVPRIIGLCDSIGDNKHNLQFDEIWSNVYYGVK